MGSIPNIYLDHIRFLVKSDKNENNFFISLN